MKANEKNVVRLLVASLVGFAFAVSSAFADATVVPVDWFSEPTANEVSTGGLSSATWSATSQGSPIPLSEVAWFDNGKLNVDVDFSTALQQSLVFTPDTAAPDGEQVFTASLKFSAAYDSIDDLPSVGESKAGLALVKGSQDKIFFAYINDIRAWAVSGRTVDNVNATVDVRVTLSNGKITYEYKLGSTYMEFASAQNVTGKITSSGFFGSGLVNSFVGQVNISGVATMDGVIYPTVADAFAAATNNAVITLLADCTFDPSADAIAEKNVKIDCDGHDFALGSGASDAAKQKGLKIVTSGTDVIELATVIPFDGSGTEAAPWKLGTTEDLWYFMYGVNAGTYGTNGEYFVQTNNLDFAEEAPWPGIGSEYDELGDKHVGFSGTYDGGEWAITGLKFANNTTGNKYRGFFNQIYNATIKNLMVETFGFVEGMSGDYGGAAVVGCMNASMVSNCVAEGTLSGTHNCGGVVGRIGVSGKIIDCANRVAIECSYTKIGGIAVIAQNIATDGEVLIQGCSNFATLSAIEGENAGRDGVAGIIAYTSCGKDDQLNIVGCVNKSTSFGGYTNSTLAQIVGKINRYRIKGEGNRVRDVSSVAIPAVGSVTDATYADGLCFAKGYAEDNPPMLLQSQTFTAANPDLILVSSNDFEVGATYYVEAPITSIAFNGLKEAGDFIKFDKTLSPTFTATVTLADDAAPGLTVVGSVEDDVLTYTADYATYTIGYYMPDATTAFTAWKSGYTAPTTFTAENTVTLPTAENVDAPAFTLVGWTNSLGVAVATTAGAYSNLVLYAQTEAKTYNVTVPAVTGVDCAVTNQSGAVSGSKSGGVWTYEVTYGDKVDIYLTPADGYLFEDGSSVKKISYDKIEGAVEVPATEIPTPVKAPVLKEWFYGLIEEGWPTKTGMKGAWSASAGEIADIATFNGGAVEVSTDGAALVFTPDDQHSFETDTTIIKSTVKYTVMAPADLPTELDGLKAGLTLVTTDAAPAYYGIVKKSGEDANEWQPLTALGDGEDGSEVDVTIELKTIGGVAKVRYTVGENKTDFLDLYVTESKVNDVAYTGDGVVAALNGIIESVVTEQTITIGEPLPDGISGVQVTTNGAAVVGAGGVYKVESGANVRIVFLPATGKILIGNTTYDITGIDQDIVFGEGDYQFPEARYTYSFKYFDGNEEFAGETVHTQNVEYVVASNDFTKTGYTFVGWTNTAAEVALYQPDDVVSNLTDTAGGEVVFTAVWAANEYNLFYTPGAGGEGTTVSKLLAFGEEHTVIAKPADFVKPHYSFECWTNATENGASYLPGDVVSNLTIVAGADVYFDAVWTVNVHTVTMPMSPDVGNMTYVVSNKTTGAIITVTGSTFPANYGTEVAIYFTAKPGYTLFGNTMIEKTIDDNITIDPAELPTCLATPDYLSFTARGGDVTIGMEWNHDWDYEGERNSVLLETAMDKNGPWTEYEAGVSNVTVAADATVYFRRKGADTALTLNPTNAASYSFTMEGSGSVEAGGNVMSLLDQTCRQTEVGERAFIHLFMFCHNLTSAPVLPAMDLAEECYLSMFAACTSLTNAPALPATNLAVSCYEGMFRNCQLLANVPALPATNLAERCYYSMFSDCASLAVAPKLPAEKMAKMCYGSMFSRCTSLTNAPALPATELAEYCYDHMFTSCTSLTNAPALPAKELKEGCYYSMFGICESLTVAPALSATNLAYECCRDMFGACNSLTAAPELPVTELADRCYYLMFQNCYALTEAPTLPATNLVNKCYGMMFMNCTNLNSVTVGFTNWCEDVNATMSWLENVAPTGIFVCPPALEIKRGDSFIPNGWLANPVAFTVKDPLAEGLSGYTLELVTEGSALVTNGTSYVVSTNDQVKITFTPAPGYDFVGDDSITATISGSGIVIGDESHPFPEVYKQDYLSFTAVGNDVTISMTNGDEPLMLEWSFDKDASAEDWVEFDAIEGSNVVVAVGDTVYFRRKGADVADKLDDWRFVFETEGTVEAGGNVMSLLDKTCRSKTVGARAFCYLFDDCTSLTTAPKLPATNLDIECYSHMFSGCTSLANAPALPAMELADDCYSGMFNNCASLANAPALPATNLAASCYYNMFGGCESLTDAPALPVTNLAASCYSSMFGGCTALTNAPALPAKELADGCYERMFYGCGKLTSAPALPAMNLAIRCYNAMFANCDMLTNAPALPAKELADGCYEEMFYYCPLLETAPVLPAMELTEGCYRNMFADCYSLNSVTVGFTNWCEDVGATADWLNNVAPTGIFRCPPALEIKRSNDDNGYNYIPEGWLVNPQTFTVKTPLAEGLSNYTLELVTVGSALVTNGTSYVVSTNDQVKITFTPAPGYDFVGDDSITATINATGIVIGDESHPFPEVYKQDYLSFTARGGEVKVGMQLGLRDDPGALDALLLETAPSMDGPWTDFVAASTEVTIEDGNTVYFRRKGADTALTLSPTNAAYYYFNMTGSGSVEAGGNVMSLLDQTCRQTEVGEDAFESLFKNCQKLTSAPTLPATELAPRCYSGMFSSCMALTNAPALPAETLAEGCYFNMFMFCRALTNAPALPAVNLAKECYRNMFSMCTSLTNAPALPAKELAEGCYASMFSGCLVLPDAPALPATNLAELCYFSMFSGCITLTNAPALPVTNLAELCYSSMFSSCKALKNAPALPAVNLVKDCYNSMFGGCTSLTDAPVLPATNLAENCYWGIFNNCTALTNAPALPATNLAASCYKSMFYGCTSLTAAPVLSAETLAEDCYFEMFKGCGNLNSVKVGFTNWLEGATTDWLENVAPTGIFVCPPALAIQRGDSYIPNGWLANPVAFTVKTPLAEGLSGYTLELVTPGSALVTNGTSYVVSTNDQVKITFTPAPGYAFVGDDFVTATIDGSGIVIGDESHPFPEVYKQDYLSFTARGGDVTIGMKWDNMDEECVRNQVLLETAMDMNGPWTEFEAGESNVTVGADATVYFRKKGTETALTLNPTNVANYSFTMTAGDGVTVEAGGNVMSLLDRTCRSKTVDEYAFCGLFSNCSALTTAPEISATNLAEACYYQMFAWCSSLTNAPALPAMNLAENCYSGMFFGCSALPVAPALPATNLAVNCYEQMFYDCDSLTTAPALPATNLVEGCYDGMFYSCESLTNAPELPAMNLAMNCYSGMFWDCTLLTDAPALPATELAVGCYLSMFAGCSSLTNAPALPATELAAGCYNNMFDGCRSLTAAPDLPATELAEYCYATMFYDCGNLNSVKVGFTNWLEGATTDWLVDVAPTGIFVCPPALEIKRNNDENGYSFIPEGWLANPVAFSVKDPLAEGLNTYAFNLITEGSAIYTNLFGFSGYAASSNDEVEVAFTAADGYRFIDGTDMLDSTVVTAKIDKADYVIGDDIAFPTATRVYNIGLPKSELINAIYAVTNGATDISDKGVEDADMMKYMVATGTTTTIAFTSYVTNEAGEVQKSFLRIPDEVTNPMVIEDISGDQSFGYLPPETPYGVAAVDITIPGVSNMTYYVSNTTYAAETFYPADCGVTNVFTIAANEDTVFVFTPATGFKFENETEEQKNPITVNTNVDYTIQDVEIPLVMRDRNTLRLEVITGLDYVVTNNNAEVEGTLNGDYWEYAIDTGNNQADIYFILADGYTTDGGYSNPLSTNVTEEVVTIEKGAPCMPKVVYWYKVQYTNGPETNLTDTVKQDAEYLISTNIYPKTGYTFLGWTNTEAEVALYVTNQVVVNLTTTPGGMVTLTTVYQPNEYTVKYTDGAEGSAVSNATYDVEFAISENVFEKKGYTFQYWTNLTDNVGYMPGDIVLNLTAEADGVVELTAVWAPNEYTVKYMDGAGHEAISNATYDVEFPIADNTFTKTGYHFTGWTNEAESVGYQPGDIVTNLTASGVYELTAVWAPNKYEVKYVANGGEGADLYTTNTYDEAFNVAGADVFTKTGYTYNSWTNADGDVYNAGDEYMNLSDGDSVTLYAAWVANSYKLAYEPGAGEGAAITNDCIYDVEYVVSNKVFTRRGYVQAGWTNLVTGIGYEFDQVVANLTDEVDGVVVLTATWTPNEYKVKYTDGAGNYAISNATYDVEFAISENVFAKEGYHFTGWTNETDNVGYQPGAIVTNLTDEADGVYELAAVWAPNKYEVKYVANGGEGDDLYTTNTYDEAFNVAGDDVFTKTGYTYNSWTNANGDVYNAGGEYMNLSTGDSVTLYAEWVANKYTLGYTPGDGTGDTVYDELTFDDETYTAREMPGDFAKEGHSFCCWTNGTDKSFLPGEPVSNLTTVAFATNYFGVAWTANVHTVTMPDVENMTYVVSNETTGAEIEVTGNEFFASYGDDITIYFTANDGYMLVGDDTTLSFTVEGIKTINTDDLPCVPRIIIGDWSDTVGVTNIEWNATNLVNLINDKDKAVWVQFRYNFDDGSPILETLPEGFGFNFVGGEGEGYPATFETTPAAGGELRKVSITGVRNTFCTKKLPVNENYFIGDRLVYEPCQIDSTPDGVDTEIEVTWAFILGGTNTIITVGGTNENDGVVTIKANDIKRDGSVAMLELTDKGQIMTKVPTNIIVAARGYTLSVSETPDDAGYYTYSAEKCGVVVYTTDVFGDPVETKYMDWDMPEDLLDIVKAWTSANPDKMATLMFNNDVFFNDGTVIPAGSEIWVMDNEWDVDVLTGEGEVAVLTRDVQPGEAVCVYGNVEFSGDLLVGSANDCYDTSITFFGDVFIDPSVEVGLTNGVAEAYAKAVMYLYGGVAFDEAAAKKFTLHKNGMVISAAQLGTEIIACDDGCSSFELNDEYHGVWIYACRLSNAKIDVKVDVPFTVDGIEGDDETVAAKIAAIAADCVIVSPEADVNAWLTASGMWIDYQKLFEFKVEATGNPGEYNLTAMVNDSAKGAIEAALDAAAAKIPDCLKVKTVMVATKPGVLYAVFSSETADGTFTRDYDWVIGTGNEVPVNFKVEGDKRFYEMKAVFKRGDN